MGPAFAALQPQQRAFVLAYVERADENASAAARAAQYGRESPTPEQAKAAAKVSGYRLIHDKKILEAIKELAADKFRTAGYKAASVLMQIMDTPGHKDQFKAAERVLAQVGMGLAVQINHNHTHTMDEKGQIQRVARLARELGLDPQVLLGSVGVNYVDAEFEVVSPALTALPEPAMSSAGLEDLL